MRLLNLLCLISVLVNVDALGQPLPPGGVTMVITEIMYDMPGTSDSLEYIELRNPSDTNERTLSLYRLTEAVDFTFPAGLIVPPNGTIVVAQDSAAFQNTFGYEAFQWTSGELNDSGELIVLRNNFNAPIDSVNYLASSPWPNASGNGHSIVLCNDTLANLGHENWTQSSNNTGISVDRVPIFANPGTDCDGWVGIEETTSSMFDVFPNPSSGIINIRLEEPRQEVEIRVANTLGKTIFTEKRMGNERLVQLDLGLSKGIYLLTLSYGNNTVTERLVIME